MRNMKGKRKGLPPPPPPQSTIRFIKSTVSKLEFQNVIARPPIAHKQLHKIETNFESQGDEIYNHGTETDINLPVGIWSQNWSI